MNCRCCQQEVTEEDFKIETSCCENICHTTCFFERVRQDWDFIECGICGAILKARVSIQSPEPVETPALTAAVKEIKKLVTASNKAERAMKTVMNTHYQVFKETAEPLLTSLTSLQRDSMAAIKQSAEYREYLKLRRKVSASTTKLRKDHTVNYRYMRHLGIRSRYRSTPSWLIKRRFRVRL